MSWITVNDVSAYTGVTYTPSEEAVLSDIIDAVCKHIENYCDTTFTEADYAQRVSVVDNTYFLDNPLQYIYTSLYGREDVLEVTPPNALSSIRINDTISTLSLINTYTKTDIDITALDLNGVVSAITAESGWSASLSSSVNNTYGRTLYPGSYLANINSSNLIQVVGANDYMDSAQKGVYVHETTVSCNEGVVIYKGGYATASFPADLKHATIKITISAYNNRASTISGNIKSEKVGDYSYTLYTASEETLSSNISVESYAVLDSYKRYTI